MGIVYRQASRTTAISNAVINVVGMVLFVMVYHVQYVASALTYLAEGFRKSRRRRPRVCFLQLAWQCACAARASTLLSSLHPVAPWSL
jgi:hypothetical protein